MSVESQAMSCSFCHHHTEQVDVVEYSIYGWRKWDGW